MPLFAQVDTVVDSWNALRVLPVLLLTLFALPLLVLARFRVHPAAPLVAALLGSSLLTFSVLVWTEAVVVIAVADVVIALAALADLLTLPGAKAFTAQREAMRVASLRQPHRVTIEINNLGKLPRHVTLRDDVPSEIQATPAEFHLTLGARTRSTVHYDFRSSRRGAFEFQAVHLRVRSRWGLWNRYLSSPCASTFHVYPDMLQLAEYAILARTNRLSQMGVRRTRRVGQDNEFERLRDYNVDDNFKHIDWRSTARRNRLTVKDFQANQSQRIIFMLDCGRMMTNDCLGVSLLDHSLNAMLMLSYVALRQSDHVGLICFSDQVHTFVPPRGGMKQMNHLLHAVFDRFPKLVESRYDEAFLYLRSHCQKRSLVVMMTNVIDDVNALQIEQYLTNLVGRHLPLAVLMRDHRLFDAAELSDRGGLGLYQAAAAADILNWRHQVLADLQRRGVLSLDVFPEQMTAPLVNSYLRIKARHLL